MPLASKWLRVACASVVVSACGLTGPAWPEPAPGSYLAKDVALSTDAGFTVTVKAAEVTPAFFPSMKAAPLLGRLFTPGDYEPASTPVALIGAELWAKSFEQRPEIIGRRVTIDGRSAVIVGVMPEGLSIPAGVELWMPRRPA
jgi:putative ABC transport system permease protein